MSQNYLERSLFAAVLGNQESPDPAVLLQAFPVDPTCQTG